MARPSTFTIEIAERIIAAKREGKSNCGAAKAAGVRDRLVRSWLARGDAGEEPYAPFAVAYRLAEEVGRRARIEEASARLNRQVNDLRADPAFVAA